MSISIRRARGCSISSIFALAAARALAAAARPAAVFLPTAGASNAERGRARGEQAGAGAGAGEAPIWRVQLREPETGEIITMTVNDRTATATRQGDPLAGD